MHHSPHSNTPHNSQGMETTYMSINREMIKMWYTQSTEYYSAIKKKEESITSRNMENIILSEISQEEKDKFHMISLICGS